MDTQDKRIDDLLFGYFMDQLSEIEEKELLDWLEADDANKRYFSEMTDWWATAHVPLFKSDMQSNYEKHFGDLADKSASLAERKRFNWRLLGKVAACSSDKFSLLLCRKKRSETSSGSDGLV